MQFAVVMRKQKMTNPWVSHRWFPQEVIPDLGPFGKDIVANSAQKIVGRFLERNDLGESWLFTGFNLNLFADEAEGYYLNISAQSPCWFVMWRLEEEPQAYLNHQSQEFIVANEALAIPHRILVSYNEAARLLDGGEAVDNIPMNTEQVTWLKEYVDETYKPEPKRRQKPASFKGAVRPAGE